MSSDGGAKLRRTIDTEEDMVSIKIEKLIVTSTASGPFLQRIAAFTNSITYVNYRDALFQLPEGNTISDIDINGSGMMRALVAGLNINLKMLHIENCLLDRVPPTLAKMTKLETLTINGCSLTGLRLDVLVENLNLTSLDLSYNKIRQIFPVTSTSRRTLSIEYLNLGGNQLERLDVSMFAIMPALERLDVRRNSLVNLEATMPATFANLAQFLLTSNRISTMNINNLVLSRVKILFLDGNNFTEIPSLSGASLPNLRSLGLEQNALSQVDLSIFRSLQTLEDVYMSSNQIESVRATSPFSLPNLELLNLDYNRISSWTMNGCDFPNLTSVSLGYNQLTTIPPLFQRYPKVRLAIEGNPIKCSSMTTFKSKITEYRLFATVVNANQKCETSSSVTIDENEAACCVA